MARTTALQVELPSALVAQARTHVAAGWAADFNTLLADALRRFLEFHSGRRNESMVRGDVEWGLRGHD